MKNIDWQNNFALFRGAVAPMNRMTDGLMEYFGTNPAWKIRAACPSGIRLIFTTDAVKLEISTVFGDAARQVFTTDVEVDGKLTTFDGAGPHTLEMAPGCKKVVIYPPHLVVLNDFQIKVNQTAAVEPVAENRPKLLICADSIMQGMTCTSPARALVALTANALDLNLHNTSVGGAIMQELTMRETLQLSTGANDVAVLALGCNNAAQSTDLDAFRKETAGALKLLAEFPGKAVVVTPIPALTVDAEKLEVYRQIIRDEKQHYPQIALLEGTSFYPAEANLFVDGVHPNDEGMQIYANALTKAIKQMI